MREGTSIEGLETQHRVLDLRIKRLERRGARMSEVERQLATRLKREKLAMKDRLYAMTRSRN